MTMTTPSSSSSSSSTASCTIVYSTQTGRARACARRTARILREKTQLTLLGGTPFDELVPSFLDYPHGQQQQQQNHFFLLFVSTTGDGVHCDSIAQTWKSLLKKSLSSNKLQGVQFALFCLGDRAYGPQFCAAGRKLAVRLMQLGATSCCEVGYGDDNTPNGGCFADLDRWIQQQLLLSSIILLEQPNTSTVAVMTNSNTTDTTTTRVDTSHYKVTVLQEQTKDAMDQWQQDWCQESYQAFFAHQSPMTAYRYDSQANSTNNTPPQQNKPLIAQVESNTRLTAPDWDQNTRHIRLQLTGYNNNKKQTTPTERQLPYQAGDIATIMPCNPPTEVERFIQTLPTALQTIADKVLHLDYYQQQQQQQQANLLGDAFPHWPAHCTLRGWLTYCADIHAPPEREDLRAISQFCSHEHDMGAAQRDKLLSLSETAASALYVDYILREKRCWTDVLYDFDSLRHLGSGLTVEALLAIVPPMRPRDFSIASAPTTSTKPDGDFVVELCVAVVEGTTPLGRSYHGLCSHYLSTLLLQDSTTVLQMWIRPGSFHGLPLTPSQNDTTSEKRRWFENPVLCIGAGTGVAPLRGLILEREAVRAAQQKSDVADSSTIAPFAATTNGDATNETQTLNQYDNLLVFGCRKRDADYYYQNEWTQLQNRMVVIPAFSREQARKVYVQQLIKQNGEAIVRHIMENDGAIYIAGGPSMARYSKEELIDATARVLLDGDEKKANLLFKKMQARGRFRVEAWS
ncbi:NADPH-dependent diflavin oxidoreductase 1 [Seminavis robusta]|uniref:NADPH-dependent diflavin oxidoreductase 1 n=1 Tax=Seminavis robusta TaxID=568900 RepID=A0A9N8H7P2_9STRA|nr:NADPH-dependent diflavin oxidoreductase 1 [Seminavis robusta]|eukprot:Sro72_g039910.1 NADPH-dependent diflavin oxidoreductase 1 (742) ;mRNA; f:71501-73726